MRACMDCATKPPARLDHRCTRTVGYSEPRQGRPRCGRDAGEPFVRPHARIPVAARWATGHRRSAASDDQRPRGPQVPDPPSRQHHSRCRPRPFREGDRSTGRRRADERIRIEPGAILAARGDLGGDPSIAMGSLSMTNTAASTTTSRHRPLRPRTPSSSEIAACGCLRSSSRRGSNPDRCPTPSSITPPS
jgi:hypothetical protein